MVAVLVENRLVVAAWGGRDATIGIPNGVNHVIAIERGAATKLIEVLRQHQALGVEQVDGPASPRRPSRQRRQRAHPRVA
jgi:hypothetical protein